MSYTTGQSLKPINNSSSAGNSSCLRVLLINSCVSRNTKALISHVKENRINLMPKVTASILEAMDRVAREAAETVGKLLNNNNNSYSTRHSHDQSLFHKLEVRHIFSPSNYYSCSGRSLDHRPLDQVWPSKTQNLFTLS